MKRSITIDIEKLVEKIEVNTSDNKNLDDIGNMVTEELLQTIKSVNKSKIRDTDVLKELLAPLIREIIEEQKAISWKESERIQDAFSEILKRIVSPQKIDQSAPQNPL